jgi:hypothetical protein
MKRHEFTEFCRLDENMWHKFMTDESEEDGTPKKKWKRREKMARADLIIQQKKESGETSNRKIVTAIVAATGVSRKTACGWLNHWLTHHEPE